MTAVEARARTLESVAEEIRAQIDEGGRDWITRDDHMQKFPEADVRRMIAAARRLYSKLEREAAKMRTRIEATP